MKGFFEKGKRKRAWVVSATVSLIAAFVVWGERKLIFSQERGLSSPRYLTTRHNVPAGQPITSIDFTLSAVPLPPSGALTDQSLGWLSGRVTRRAMLAGEVLTQEATELRQPRETLGRRIPKGLRAYAFPLEDALEVFSGDKVDVVLSPESPHERPSLEVEAALVLQVSPMGGYGKGERRELILAVSEGEIQQLEKARRKGKLTLALRNPGEPSPSKRGRKKFSGFSRPPQFSVEILAEGE
jgi:Flp pilus assembly protein CpaB